VECCGKRCEMAGRKRYRQHRTITCDCGAHRSPLHHSCLHLAWCHAAKWDLHKLTTDLYVRGITQLETSSAAYETSSREYRLVHRIHKVHTCALVVSRDHILHCGQGGILVAWRKVAYGRTIISMAVLSHLHQYNVMDCKFVWLD
jgi:hypothetical protein